MLDEDAGARVITMRSILAVARIVGFGIKSVHVYRSQSGKGRHYVIETDREWSDLEIVCLQSIMGSDIKRETLNLARVINSGNGGRSNRWNVLYNRKINLERKKQ